MRQLLTRLGKTIWPFVLRSSKEKMLYHYEGVLHDLVIRIMALSSKLDKHRKEIEELQERLKRYEQS